MIKTKIKICGLTQKDQAVQVAELGIDAIGFILYPKSPRYVAPQVIKEIIQALPPFTKTVGVVVNEQIESIETIMHSTGLDLVQLSGEESPEYCNLLTERAIPWIKGFRIRGNINFEELTAYKKKYVLLDAWSADEYGGTGKVFDWSVLDTYSDKPEIVLAGGITANNVLNAIQQTRPYAIDVSSGVEVKPGIKSIEKVRELVELLS